MVSPLRPGPIGHHTGVHKEEMESIIDRIESFSLSIGIVGHSYLVHPCYLAGHPTGVGESIGKIVVMYSTKSA